MLIIDYQSSKSLHEQIYDEIVRLILSKALKPDEKMPSVRELASLLKINPNTIQKAYKNLETDQYIYTVKGIGNFVKSADELREIHINKEKHQLSNSINLLKELKLTEEEIFSIIKDILKV